ncbi:MAG: flagellar filament capping protein FliD [Rhodoferax sp.]|nr:flagellar filament capping protein FliD [Rhodoferax sp.]
MNINDFINANSASRFLGSSPAARTAASTDGLSKGLQKAENRIQAQVDSTNVQLSAFGKLQSAVSQTQTSAKAAAGLSSSAKAEDVKTAATKLVDAFNNTIDTAKGAASAAGETATGRNATRVGRDLTRTVTSDDSTLAALKQIGASVNANGKLVLDTAKFDAAQKTNATDVRNSLVKLGQQIDKTALKELGNNGSVGSTVSALNQRSSTLKFQQASLASLQQTTGSSSSGSNPRYFGLAAYQNG